MVLLYPHAVMITISSGITTMQFLLNFEHSIVDVQIEVGKTTGT